MRDFRRNFFEWISLIRGNLTSIIATQFNSKCQRNNNHSTKFNLLFDLFLKSQRNDLEPSSTARVTRKVKENKTFPKIYRYMIAQSVSFVSNSVEFHSCQMDHSFSSCLQSVVSVYCLHDEIDGRSTSTLIVPFL